MGKRTETYVVTHSYAPDPDPAKVQATLDLWKHALAERALAGQPTEAPIARIALDPDRRVRRRRRSQKTSGSSAGQ